ncbi:MAG: DUF763 domain-containing protein [Chloroflexi bacterium]|nr:DUF763 domain-containing protein [Chloroflexota bacterium]
MKTGTANLPLHYGKAPRWLFERMTRLAREITIGVVAEFGPEDMLRRMADPFWFQALGCILGFDWHSSGVTTTVCGALKEGIKGLEPELGLFIAGGKGRTSRQTPLEIQNAGTNLSTDTGRLVYASRMAAKVDSAAVQDGYQLYHHCFFFTASGSWAVVQQGMNETIRYARRYHWLGDTVADFVCEPHNAVCCDLRGQALNLVAADSSQARSTIATIVAQGRPEKLITDLDRLGRLELPSRHHITPQDVNPKRLRTILLRTYELQPASFEALLGLAGVGARTIRALSLISELVYGVPSCYTDPARYSFAHGGKDGHPYPVDRRTYDKSIELVGRVLRRARLSQAETEAALRRLNVVEEWAEASGSQAAE